MTIGSVEERICVLSGVFRQGGQYSDAVDP